jgi:glycosyltransferase involved in cell wall biosynthesis
MGLRPAATVVVLSYQARQRIDVVLQALRRQDTDESFEVVVVDSGTDGCDAYVREHYPEVNVVHSPVRLRPGPARNRGVEAANGSVLAFLPDDGIPRHDWLRRRLALHEQGFQAVGGAITNGCPQSYVASAAHMLEYSSLLPHDALLRAQEVPHCLSFARDVFETVGHYPEDTLTGEDTLFNRRCLLAGIRCGFSAEIHMAHLGLTSFSGTLRHAFGHGRGLMQCTERHDLGSVIGDPETVWNAVWRALVVYPTYGVMAKLRRLRHYAPELLSDFAKGLPIIVPALVTTGAGALVEWVATRRESHGPLEFRDQVESLDGLA